MFSPRLVAVLCVTASLFVVGASKPDLSDKYNYFENSMLKGVVSPGKFGIRTALSKDGKVIVVGADSLGGYKGGVYAYRRKTKYSDKWTQIGEIITPKEELNTLSFFGASLDLSDDGKLLAVGAFGYGPGNDKWNGAVWIFSYDKRTNSYMQTADPLTLEEEGAEFGSSIAMTGSGKILAIGASLYKGQAGAVYIYKRSSHSQEYSLYQGPLFSQDPDDFQSNLGYSLTISNDGKVVTAGAPFYEEIKGRVFTFSLNSETKKYELMDIIQGDDGDNIGAFVSMSGNAKVLAIGGDDSGKAWVYSLNRKSGTSDLMSVIESESGPYDTMNVAFSNNGKVLVVGAMTAFVGGSASIYAWDKVEEEWMLVDGPFDDGTDGDDFSLYGEAVAIDGAGKTWTVGAPNYNNADGAVYVYGSKQ